MNSRKLVLLASIGAGLEYYDFTIYALLAHYLSQVFFSLSDTRAATLEVFAVFALGYLVRPLGGLIMAHFGDRFGRRKTFLASLILMAIATFLIGLLPGYQVIGLYATVGLILLRLLQGFAFGAEMPGLITYVAEQAMQIQRGQFIGVAMASLSIGGMLGAIIMACLTQALNPVQMLNFGWRVPFLLGGSLAIVSYFIRRKLTETPAFMQQPMPSSKPLVELIQQHWRKLIVGISVSVMSACFIIFVMTLPAYLQQFYHYPTAQVYWWVTASLIWSALSLPLAGWLADRVGRRQILLLTTVVLLFSSFFLFRLLDRESGWALALFLFIFEIFISLLACTYLPLLTELFPTSVRMSGVAFCYNTIYCIAGFTPLITSKIAQACGQPHNAYVFFVGLAIITIIGMRWLPAQKHL